MFDFKVLETPGPWKLPEAFGSFQGPKSSRDWNFKKQIFVKTKLNLKLL
jgi:hypothetical protein